jgi:hypothetical protein
MMTINAVRRMFMWLVGHRHSYVENYYDLRADVLGGPRTFHGIRWICTDAKCAKVIDGGSQP